MADREYRVNLTSPLFPLLSENFGRTIISPPAGENVTEEATPQIYYGHNILPTKRGYDSVAFSTRVSAIEPADVLAENTVEIKGDAKTRLQLTWNTTGEPYVLKPGASSWLKLAATVPVTTSASFDIDTITIGNVNGISYIYYRGIACFTYNETTDTLVEVTLTGLALGDIIGISSSSGYLIAYTEDALAWSSTISPIDFTPDPVTGAGGGAVADIKGAIKFVFSNSLGLLIYSETNVVAATYTGNTNFPFKSREVDASKGGISPSLVAHAANSRDQFVFSRGGIQSVSSQRAAVTLPEVTDFFIRELFEDFDETTLQFTITPLASPMLKKVAFIASRYFVISYGVASYTHAIVYDIALERMGKLKISHVHCFEFASTEDEISSESIAFLQIDGTVKLVEFAPSISTSGVLLVGKFQFIRSRLIGLQQVEIESIEESATFSMYDLYSLDGKTTILSDAGYLAETVEGLRKYYFHTVAKDHSLLLIGAFKLNTLLLTYTIHGRR